MKALGISAKLDVFKSLDMYPHEGDLSTGCGK